MKPLQSCQEHLKSVAEIECEAKESKVGLVRQRAKARDARPEVPANEDKISPR